MPVRILSSTILSREETMMQSANMKDASLLYLPTSIVRLCRVGWLAVCRRATVTLQQRVTWYGDVMAEVLYLAAPILCDRLR
jgi:hypothetical protein